MQQLSVSFAETALSQKWNIVVSKKELDNFSVAQKDIIYDPNSTSVS